MHVFKGRSRRKNLVLFIAACLVIFTYWFRFARGVSAASISPQPPTANLSSPPPLIPSPITSNSNTKTIDVFLYETIDSKFNLTFSGLSPQTMDLLAKDVSQIWYEATQGRISLRIHRRQRYLTPNQQLAHLFHVFGHPRIPPNRKQTEIQVSKDWILALYATQIADCERATFPSSAQILPLLPLDKQAYEANFPAHANAFACLMGDPETQQITQESWQEYVQVRGKTRQVQNIHLAFRLFYLDAGLSVKRAMEFASVMQSKPMLFLHYAIGRDEEENLGAFKVARTDWEFANTLSLFPVPFYHEMNGRGSPNWMDVLFRTSSCFEDQVRLKWKTGYLPVQCRWGVRKWERHVYKPAELARMVAHEIGHCLGLEHFEPRCKVFENIHAANLMQQQRVLALAEWAQDARCTCLQPTCGDCRCELDDVTFEAVGNARALSEEQIQLALRAAMNMKNVEALEGIAQT